MKKDTSLALIRELIVLRGSTVRGDSNVYSMSERFLETQKIIPPLFMAQHRESSNDYYIRLIYVSDWVWGVRLRLNFRLLSELDNVRQKLSEEKSVLLEWQDDRAGFQFYLTKNHTQGSELHDLLAVEQELFLLGAGMYANLLEKKRPVI